MRSSHFSSIQEIDLDFFRSVCGPDFVVVATEQLLEHGHDETEDLSFPPEALVFPGTAEEISKILKHCNERKIPVTTLGARTGLSGGALCVFGGLGLSMKRFNQILEIDEENLQAVVQPGVITQVLQETVAAKGLYYAPDPSSRGSCFLGGNLAENAGGPHAVKYGVTKDFVLSLQVVLANGDIIETGARTLKNSTGYNLTQLIVGSEGTLAVITRAVVKLIALPKHQLLMLIPFDNAVNACAAVSAIFRAGVTPSAIEFMERDAIDWTLQYVSDVQLPVGPEVRAHLLVEVDGQYEDVLMRDCERIAEVVAGFGAGDILFAEDDTQKNQLWKLRRRVAEAVKANSVYKEEDTVVPRAALPLLLTRVKEVGDQFGFKSVCYGHAGDGNLHVNIIRADQSEEQWNQNLTRAIRLIFESCVELGGTLSGEHGIGWVQKNYMDIAFPTSTLSLMKQVKHVFDPNGILNPGKIFPD